MQCSELLMTVPLYQKASLSSFPLNWSSFAGSWVFDWYWVACLPAAGALQLHNVRVVAGAKDGQLALENPQAFLRELAVPAHFDCDRRALPHAFIHRAKGALALRHQGRKFSPSMHQVFKSCSLVCGKAFEDCQKQDLEHILSAFVRDGSYQLLQVA